MLQYEVSVNKILEKMKKPHCRGIEMIEMAGYRSGFSIDSGRAFGSSGVFKLRNS